MKFKDRLKEIKQTFSKKVSSAKQGLQSFIAKQKVQRKNEDKGVNLEGLESKSANHLKIGESKFSTTPRTIVEPRPMREELPFGYGEDKIILQVRDPWWIHSYWEITHQTIDKMRESLGEVYHSAIWTLRAYDVSFIIFDGNNAHNFFDISINLDARNWYIQVSSGRSFCLDLGLKLPDGRFIMVLRSNTVTTPLDGPSWITDEEWLIPEDLFKRLYGLSFGVGSSPGKGIKEIKQERFVSSPGFASMASPVKIREQQRQFWLSVNTELILYGQTKPDAKLTVMGKEVKLKQDGTFSLRFALPDGKLTLPVRAESKDGIDARVITPVVTKETK